MEVERKENFEYVTNGRYLIELLDIESGRTYYTRRIRGLGRAVGMAGEYNSSKGLEATIIDTKTGEMI